MGSVEVVAQPARIKVQHSKTQIPILFIFIPLSKAYFFQAV